jgi:F420-dependent oxidoreductase-like protein
VDVAIMIEGQNGLNWPRWQRLALAVEELGFAGLYRSDHFTNTSPPDLDSLELWTSLAWLASHTRRIEFGPLVSPFSFRDPVFTARMGKDVDELSGGRLILGVGAGWQEREHRNFGYDLLDKPRRFRRFQEGLEVIVRLLRSDEPVSFDGEFYRLHEAVLLPRPSRRNRPPILIGGNGLQRTLALAARYADEWNGVLVPPEKFAELNARLDRLLAKNGRELGQVRRSLMTGIVWGRDSAETRQKLAARGGDATKLRERGILVGGPGEVKEQLARLAQVGVQRLMVQWMDLDDLEGLEGLARAALR